MNVAIDEGRSVNAGPPPCMQKYAISRVTFHRGAGRRATEIRCEHQHSAKTAQCQFRRWKKQKFKCEHQQPVRRETAQMSEFNGALEEGLKVGGRPRTKAVPPKAQLLKLACPHGGTRPAALHAKVCNQSRNAPGGLEEGSRRFKSERTGNLVIKDVAAREVGESGDEPTALHAKVCQYETFPAGRGRSLRVQIRQQRRPACKQRKVSFSTGRWKRSRECEMRARTWSMPCYRISCMHRS